VQDWTGRHTLEASLALQVSDKQLPVTNNNMIHLIICTLIFLNVRIYDLIFRFGIQFILKKTELIRQYSFTFAGDY